MLNFSNVYWRCSIGLINFVDLDFIFNVSVAVDKQKQLIGRLVNCDYESLCCMDSGLQPEFGAKANVDHIRDSKARFTLDEEYDQNFSPQLIQYHCCAPYFGDAHLLFEIGNILLHDQNQGGVDFVYKVRSLVL
ncbi:hypothetical protein RHMOL_Rhmol04G0317800 [Rhododendron molle]|uniref:Uncharacterized protein n=1 Tax=Rhododendron molle TaxID=49168 RepID=A0ACC0P7I9_RHOML|nr:hypothetical protein RHMOL_Rhmol04G0317800 [Rhododendron molle]